VPGLGARLGRGGATTTLQELANSDSIVIMGSNMAENHPVGFRFVMQAKARGATVVHVDPRFSRTSAMADLFLPIRAGSDLVLLGALVNYVLERNAYFREYVVAYTNASSIVSDEFRDTEDLDGLFSGFDPARGTYQTDSWAYAGQESNTGAPEHQGQDAQSYGHRAGGASGRPHTDPTLQNPRCVFQIVKRHYARYTPEMVEEACGVPRDHFLKLAQTIVENSGRERTTSFAYAVAWTQHTIGSQIISCCALLQLLLGNIGRPGGGIMALRGHATIQGSTDIPTLYNLLPGYLPMPSTAEGHTDLDAYLTTVVTPRGTWANAPKYLVSLLKAWYGENATPENQFGYRWLPKLAGDFSFQVMLLAMKDGNLRGLFCMGQNPAVGGQNTRLVREGLAKLDWLVVRDVFDTETSSFWQSAPEVVDATVSPSSIGTEVFLMPAAVTPEKDGSYTNTMRLVQFHDKAVEPPGDARSEAHFVYHLGRRLKELYADSTLPRDAAIQALTWDYPTRGVRAEPEAEAILVEINGYTVADGHLVPGYAALQDDGSTACGCWIYSGIMPAPDRNRARDRDPSGPNALGWGYSWPNNVRVLYNRASADPDGQPWSERKRYVWWDADAERWTGLDTPDFPVAKSPAYQPPDGARGLDGHSGQDPFVMLVEGKGRLFVPSGLKDGPLPTHYEPFESPVANPLYREQTNPAAIARQRDDNRYHAVADERYPHVLTTYRLTEHHTGGAMTRWLPWLAELQPEGFAEIGTELASELGIENGGWVVVSTERAEIETRALVTDRLTPIVVGGRRIHQAGLPWHFGYMGLAKGAVANDLSAIVEDPDSFIHEAKSFTCAVRPGRLGAPPPAPVPSAEERGNRRIGYPSPSQGGGVGGGANPAARGGADQPEPGIADG
jgi:formate dehydrogenase major subunit